MPFLDALKQATRRLFPAWGGQQGVGGSSLGSDWTMWRGNYATSGFDYKTSAGELYANPIVQSCVAWMCKACLEPRLQVVREEASGEENPVPSHPLVDLLRRPNPHTTHRQLLALTVSDWLLYGNSYWLKVRSGTGRPLELWHTPPNRIRPEWAPTGTEFIGSYRLKVDGRDSIWQPEDVVHFRFGQDPVNQRLGWSPLQAGLKEIAALNEGSTYRGALLRNRAVASHLVSSKDAATPLQKEQAQALEALWISKTSGDSSGRPLFSTIPLDIEKLGYSPKDLDLGTMLNWDADTVCCLLGLSSMVVGISAGSEHRTYANYAEAREAAFEQAVIPTLADLAEIITGQLLGDFGDAGEERVEFDLSDVRILQEDQTALWKRLDDAVKTGWLLPNEARNYVGLPEMEGGDQPVMQGIAKPPAPQMPPESQGDRAVTAAQPASPNGNGRRADQ